MLLDDGSILPFVDGRCPHLTEAGRCRIHATRPRGCREFDCSQEAGYLRTHPRVAALLSLHGIPLPTPDAPAPPSGR